MKRFTLIALVILFGLGAGANAQVSDTSKVRIGKKEYTVISDGDVKIYERDNHKHKSKMNGTWEGLGIGLTNFVNTDYSMDLPADAGFMELDMGRSWGVNFNFAERSLGVINNYVGIVTGLGLEYNRYMLSNDVKIAELDGMMTGTPIDMNLDKNRLSMTYLNIPLLVEFQVPVYGESKRIILSGGVVGGVKIGSRQVQKYEAGGEKQKIKTKDSFNLRTWRYGFTARIGFGDIVLFANYYPQTLFNDGMGPDIYPVTVGLHFGD